LLPLEGGGLKKAPAPSRGGLEPALSLSKGRGWGK